MYARQDSMVPGPEWGGLEGNDVDVMTPEIAHWKATSKTRFSVYVIEETSHDFPLIWTQVTIRSDMDQGAN